MIDTVVYLVLFYCPLKVPIQAGSLQLLPLAVMPLLLVKFVVTFLALFYNAYPSLVQLSPRVFGAARGGGVHRDRAQPQGRPGEGRGVDEVGQMGRGKRRGESG